MRWRGRIAEEGVESIDGRTIAPDALTWRPLPLPFSIVNGGRTVGIVDEIVRVGPEIQASGLTHDPVMEHFLSKTPLGAGFSCTTGNVRTDGEQWVMLDGEIFEVCAFFHLPSLWDAFIVDEKLLEGERDAERTHLRSLWKSLRRRRVHHGGR